MKVLLLGAGGQVGRAVVAARKQAHELLTRTHAELDISSAGAVERCIESCAPAWVVNAAAYTAVDQAESEPERAYALNGAAVGTLARAAAAVGARLLHLSTDFVFDGKSSRPYLPGDATHPLSVYGASKRAGEERALESGARAIVLRTAWVYAAVGRNFVSTMLRLMSEKPEVRVVSDQVGTPTYAGGLGRIIWDLIEADVPAGILHWTDLGVASWYDFAVAIQEEALARRLLQRAVPVQPITTVEYQTAARRPAYSVLDTRATRACLAAPARHWRENLRVMLDELRAA